MRNSDIVRLWSNCGIGSTANLRTDGENLYSYQMKIGRTLKDGTKQVLNVMSPNFYSNTTSHHVSLAKRVTYDIVEPTRQRQGYGTWYAFPECNNG